MHSTREVSVFESIKSINSGLVGMKWSPEKGARRRLPIRLVFREEVLTPSEGNWLHANTLP